MDDMIDFECSPTFRDHYYSQGLTPRRSGRPASFQSPQLHKLIEELREWRQALEQRRELPSDSTISPQAQYPPDRNKTDSHTKGEGKGFTGMPECNDAED
jgi:hypothetical protein